MERETVLESYAAGKTYMLTFYKESYKTSKEIVQRQLEVIKGRLEEVDDYKRTQTNYPTLNFAFNLINITDDISKIEKIIESEEFKNKDIGTLATCASHLATAFGESKALLRKCA